MRCYAAVLVGRVVCITTGNIIISIVAGEAMVGICRYLRTIGPGEDVVETPGPDVAFCFFR